MIFRQLMRSVRAFDSLLLVLLCGLVDWRWGESIREISSQVESLHIQSITSNLWICSLCSNFVLFDPVPIFD
jgi:hypothetical protein